VGRLADGIRLVALGLGIVAGVDQERSKSLEY
jgi:hypothetical protein